MFDSSSEYIPLAHSAREAGRDPDPYSRHVAAVRQGAVERAQRMLEYAADSQDTLLHAVDAAAQFHDLGKLDQDIQEVLRNGRGGRLAWDHIDAGVSHLSAAKCYMAAWLVRAHHAPGLPDWGQHFTESTDRKLRGRRHDTMEPMLHEEQIRRTNAHLDEYLALHRAAVGENAPVPAKCRHGLAMRLALSCLVDADHADTAFFDSQEKPEYPPEPRWPERLESLRRYVGGLPSGLTEDEKQRNALRRAFFEACLNSVEDSPLLSCEASVGMGKTTAVTAYLLRRACDENLRRLFVVAPFTNILTQTAKTLRKALVLEGEDPDRVVMEHHHRADFSSSAERDLAVLWQAPVILTTAVSFFEALAGCSPKTLRKLHALPGSAIFIDEAHAAIPTVLWPQNWRWLRQLVEQWGCRVVLASGSLARFWENEDIVDEACTLPDLLPKQQLPTILSEERHRVRYSMLEDGVVLSLESLLQHIQDAPGPVLVILNTVQNAAYVAMSLRDAGRDVLHLSTALAPRDREPIVERVKRKLADSAHTDWCLVATSCVEAGVDFSFRTAFRERFSVSSIIQVGGRVNRNGEFNALGGGMVYDFALSGEQITQHPAALHSGSILFRMLSRDVLNHPDADPARLVTEAMARELEEAGGLKEQLQKAEASKNYPAVSDKGQVIQADTRLVVVDEELAARIARREPVHFTELLQASVQLWASKIESLRLQPIPGRSEIYRWEDEYDPDFLGYMAGMLKNQAVLTSNGCWLI